MKRKSKPQPTKDQLKRAYERLLGEEFDNLEEAQSAFAEEMEEQTVVVVGKDFDQLEEFIDSLENHNAGLETLFNRHVYQEGYDFYIEDEILKVSISTTKTRKKFSVRS